MPKQTPVIRNKLSPDPGTEPTLNQPIPGKETKELLYSNEEFENFLKHAELAGISRKRQDELIAMFLAEDVTLEEIILDSFQKLVQIMSKYRVRIMMFVLVLGLVVFVQDSFDRASMGYQEYQPWQFEMSAKMKNWQIKVDVLLSSYLNCDLTRVSTRGTIVVQKLFPNCESNLKSEVYSTVF